MWRCCTWGWAWPTTPCGTFEASAALKPESAPAQFNLGTALAQAGRFQGSIVAFRAALALRPDYALAHGNLGRVLLAQNQAGRSAEAPAGGGPARSGESAIVAGPRRGARGARRV